MISPSKTLLAVLLASSLALPLHARDLNAADRAELQARIDSFSESFRVGDLDAVMDVMPLKMLDSLAAQSGMTSEQLKSAMVAATKQAMSQVEIVSYSMDMGAATFAQSATGRGYALVPTVTVMKIDGQTIEGSSQTLAFEEDDIWYLVRIDNAQQVQMLTSTYPEFADVNFPSGSMRIVE